MQSEEEEYSVFFLLFLQPSTTADVMQMCILNEEFD